MVAREISGALQNYSKAAESKLEDEPERTSAYIARFIDAAGSLMGIPAGSLMNLGEIVAGVRATALPKD
jgi:hypothetical protein